MIDPTFAAHQLDAEQNNMPPEMEPITHFQQRFLLSSLAFQNSELTGAAKTATPEILEHMASAFVRIATIKIAPALVKELSARYRIIWGEMNTGDQTPEHGARFGAMMASAIADLGLQSHVERLRAVGLEYDDDTMAIERFTESYDHLLGDYSDLARIDLVSYLVEEGNSMSIPPELINAVQHNSMKIAMRAIRYSRWKDPFQFQFQSQTETEN